MNTFLCYERCTTCRKAAAWLNAHGIEYTTRDIAADHPSRKELASWQKASGLPLTKFFNTSGKKYRELNLKDRLKTMSDDEMLDLLASDGMLVKRPVLTDGKTVLIGFREEAWKSALAD